MSVHLFHCCPDWLSRGSDSMSQAFRDGNSVLEEDSVLLLYPALLPGPPTAAAPVQDNAPGTAQAVSQLPFPSEMEEPPWTQL